jgi:ELWxxDGT repeat protein
MQTTAGNESNRPEHEDQGEQNTPDHPPHRHRRWLAVVQTLTLVTVLLLATYNHALIGATPEKTTATPWLVESEPFEPVAPCNQGGYYIHTGFDINGNDVLDEGERQDTTSICHGLRGLSGPQGQAGDSGEHAPIQLVSTEAVSPHNSTCPEGGMTMHSGLDLNENDVLDEGEIISQATLCNGIVGRDGDNGTNGVDGTRGAGALVDKVAAPSYICADGFVVRFGVDDGNGEGVANNDLLEGDEVRETLNFCFEPLRSERVTDLLSGTGNSMTSGCDAAVWADGLEGLVFAGNDGTNGCELHLHRPGSNETTMVVNLHPNGDALPGRDLGLHAINGGTLVLFDATDGANGRQLWVTDGTENGTRALGPVEAVAPHPWADGLLFRSPTNDLLWTNGSDLRTWTSLPVWTTVQQQAVAANLSGLNQFGQAWLHADQHAVWFSASDTNGDVEPYRLEVDGTVTAWSVNAFGSSQLANLLSVENDVLAAASRGGVKQVLRLHDNGTHTWVTSIAPASGDTRLGEGMGLHLIGNNLIFDAETVAGEPRLWTSNLANGITLQLSSSILAPGAQVGVANTGTRLMFDCLTASTGLETCMTDGTPQGSRVVHDLTPGLMSSDVRAIASVGDGWLVVSDGMINGSSQGVSLWVVEGEAMRPAYNPWTGSGNSSAALTYGQLVVGPTQAWMIAHDGVHGHEWHRWSHGELSDDWIVIRR